MRIALVTATFPPYKGGSGNVCYHNARELVRHDHDVHVFTCRIKGSLPYEEDHGIHIHRLTPLFHFGNASFLPQLAIVLSKYNLVHLHYPFFGGEFVALSTKLTRTPLIVTYHQDVILKGPLSVIEKILRLTVEKAVLRSARQLLFTSFDYSKQSYIRPLLTGREECIGELPNGVDTSEFTPGEKPKKLCQEYCPETGDQVVILVARLDRAHYFKGVDVFLRALANLPSSIKGIIIGDGELKPNYEILAQELGLRNRVYFPGQVSDNLLKDYYRLAEITVLPSVTMGEAFGLVLIESMACGTPVIASNLPGVRTVVSDGEDGILINPGDVPDLVRAIQQILQAPGYRLLLGRSGRRKVEEKYAWTTIGDQLDRIYASASLRKN